MEHRPGTIPAGPARRPTEQRLLVLAGEVVLAECAPDRVERDLRLTGRMKHVSGPAPESSRPKGGVDSVLLVVFGDGREANQFPGFLLEQPVVAEPETITSIGMRDWAHIGQG